jgi:hypothetical protein
MRKLTRTEANFENLLEAALLVEGHCSHASHGCSCRGCDECEENYMMESEEGEKESLADLIDRYVEGKPDTKDRYEGSDYLGDPRGDEEEYNAEEEEDTLNVFSKAMDLALAAPDSGFLGLKGKIVSKRTKDIMSAADKIAGTMGTVADGFQKAANRFVSP